MLARLTFHKGTEQRLDMLAMNIYTLECIFMHQI
jgi:hypothetical protein